MNILSSTWNKILFRFFPSKLIKRYTGKKAYRMYFIREYELAIRQIWRAEFFREMKQELREEIRREYDKATETLDAVQQRIEVEKKKEDSDKTILEQLEKSVEAKKKDISQFKEQIDHIDTEVSGYTEALESLRVTLPLVEKYIKKWEN